MILHLLRHIQVWQWYIGTSTIWKEYFSENFMDSVLILANIALSLDNQLSEAYTLRGIYYTEIGKPEQAIEEFDKAIKLNPNDWMALWCKKQTSILMTDLVNHINCLQKAASINRGRELPSFITSNWLMRIFVLEFLINPSNILMTN